MFVIAGMQGMWDQVDATRNFLDHGEKVKIVVRDRAAEAPNGRRAAPR